MRTQNSRGFLFPILFNRELLREAGIHVRLFDKVANGIEDCSALLVDGKALDARAFERGEPERLLALWGSQVPLGYFDLTDSATTVSAEVFPYVSRYYKNQLVIDRSALMRPLYGRRLYTDYYHRTEGVDDNHPQLSTPIGPAEIAKLRVSWNSSLANYAWYGPRLSVLFELLPWRRLLFYPRQFESPKTHRGVGINCRMNTQYARRTIAHQRLRTAAVLRDYAPATRVSKAEYFRELRSSRLATSPFGWGEINQKDFECFLSGVAIVKPDVSHLETWPSLFESGRTYVAHSWDLSDLIEKSEYYLRHDHERQEIATLGQDRYRRQIATREGNEAFCARFIALIDDLCRTPAVSSIRPHAPASTAS